MKKILTTVLALVMAGGFSAAQRPASESIGQLMKTFPSPGKEYRSVPFMVWNGEVTKYQIDNTLTEYSRQGCGGVIVHPRPGLVTEYLSPEWFDLFDYTVQKGHQLGLEVWLYDENSYPSGFAGGHVPAQMPESYNRGIGLKAHPMDTMPDDVSKYELIVSEKNGKLTDITAKAPKMKGKTGKFYLYDRFYYEVSPWFAGFSYVDLMAKGVTEKFIDVTMQGYEKRAKDNLPAYIRGVFTDEPQISAWQSVRWTPDMFDQFEARFGYDLRPWLPALQHEIGGDWRKVRHDYYVLQNDMFIERWAKPWYNYCAQKGIDWTGHYWEHDWLVAQRVPDNMAMAAWQQQPGIDMLFNQFDEKNMNAQFGNVRSVKEVSSIANQLGRKRVLSETYGGAGWQVTFKDMKRLADWEMVLGVNFVNQHVGHMSMNGVRKFDYPPMFNRAASWWNDYYVLNDYLGRICAAMSMGQQINDVLVLEPTTTAWMYNISASGLNEMPAVKKMGQKFQALVTELEHAQVEYDLGCEHTFLLHGSVRDGKFVVGERAYSTVIVPAEMENIEGKTYDLLKQFVAQGGTLVALGTPSRLDGALSAEVPAFFAGSNVVKASECTPELIERYLRRDAIRFGRISGGDVHHNRREYKDGQTLLLVNASLDEASEVEVTLRGKQVVRLDGMDGKTYQIPFTAQEGKVTVKTRIEPAGSVLLSITDQPVEALPCFAQEPGTALAEMRPLQISRVKDNVLLIDFLDLVNGDKRYENIYYNMACRQVFQNAGLQDDPWNRSIQYKRNIVDMKLPKDDGFTATYKFTVAGNVDKASMKILVEQPWRYTVKVNGQPVRSGHSWLVDEDFRTMGIGSLVKEGENVIEVIADKTTVFTELGPVYVLGNFNVENRAEHWTIVPAQPYRELKSWKEEGAPFYPWEMAYSRFYDVSDTTKRHWVEAPHWEGSLVEVWVNDRKAGAIIAEPFRCDVTPFIVNGANRIELRVVGNMQNFIGPHHDTYTGMVSPNSWEVKEWRPASKYVLSPFGLTGDFVLKESK